MYIDLLLLIFVISFAVIGLWQGFFQQLVSLASLTALIFLSFPLANSLHQSSLLWFQKSPLLVLWGVACFLIIVGSSLIRWGLNRWVQWSPLGALDRWMGLSFGALKGVVIALLIGMGFQVLFEEQRDSSTDFAQEMASSKFLVASSDVLSFGLFGWSEAVTLFQEHLRPNHRSQRALPRPSLWSEE
ncbi:MAG: CvpA family protein [Bradymonadales bacterium]|nr:MAG: CvpA family protein [Bradymonadales bacterium]